MHSTYSIGVDLGGTNLRIAAYSAETGLLDAIQLSTRLAEGPHRVVGDMSEAIQGFIARDFGGRKLAGIGVGTPGPLQLPEGILRNPPNLPGWDGFNLRAALESILRQAVVIESDANLAALAEQKLGAGRTYGMDSLCALTLGTGVGGGIILKGQVWHGSTGMGGEAGHIIVQSSGGVPCGCGGAGCLEQYASATAVVRMAAELMGETAPATSHEVAMLAFAGDPRAARVFRQVGSALAVGLTALINTLNLPLFVIGGGVCEAWDLFASTMFAELEVRSYVYRLTRPQVSRPGILNPVGIEGRKTYILRAQLGSGAGLLGACLLPLHEASHVSTPAEAVFVHQ